MATMSKTNQTHKARVAQKIAKEATISRLLQEELSEYSLVETSSYVKGANSFTFGRFKKEWPNSTLLIFSGDNSAVMCELAKEYLTRCGHKVSDYKKNKDKGFLLNLSKVTPSTIKQDLLRLRAASSDTEVTEEKETSRDLAATVKKDAGLSNAATLVELFHESRLILGVRNKDNTFKRSEDGALAVCWNYINELEVAYVLYESERLFGYMPVTKKGVRGEEVVVVWDLSKIPLDVDRRKLRHFDKRTTKAIGVTPVDVVDFLCKKVMRLVSPSYSSNSCEKDYAMGCFSVSNVNSRADVFKWLDRFGITYLASEKDGGRFWVALTDETVHEFKNYSASKEVPPTEFIKQIHGRKLISPTTQTDTPKMEKSEKHLSHVVAFGRTSNPTWSAILGYFNEHQIRRRQTGKDNDYSVATIGSYMRTISLSKLSERAIGILKNGREEIMSMPGVEDVIFSGPNTCKIMCGVVEPQIDTKTRREEESGLKTEVKARPETQSLRTIVVDFLRSKRLKRVSPKGGNDYMPNLNLKGDKLALTSLSKKAKKLLSEDVFVQEMLGIDPRIVRAGFFDSKDNSTPDTFQVYFKPAMDSEATVSSTDSQVSSPQEETNLAPSNMASHVRMFMALSLEDQKECIAHAGLQVDGRKDILRKLEREGVLLVDSVKGKSLLEALKVFDALVKPEDIL